jgi:trehalose 6-phosphate synthase
MPRNFSCDQVARAEAESFSSIVNDGRRVLVGAFPISARDQKVYLVVLHDLSYLDARLGQIQTFAAAGLVGLAMVFAAIAGILVLIVLRRWTRSLRRAIEDVRSGRPPRASP